MSPEFCNSPNNFCGGKLASCIDAWGRLTDDSWVLQQIQGVQVNFILDPSHAKHKQEIRFSDVELDQVKTEAMALVEKGVIYEVDHVEGEYLSNIFTREKKNGELRVILNLKQLNQCVEKIHFKMDTLKNAIALMKKDCFFASIDLKDAYYSVNIHPKFRKFFRFMFQGKLYEFRALPQGFRDSPRIFTKILKPVLAHLHQHGHSLVIYIDDSLIQGDTYTLCAEAVHSTAQMLDELGFTIHPAKSMFQPSQSIEFLGFNLDSVAMTVSLTPRKAEQLAESCSKLLNTHAVSIRHLAEVIGKLVAAQPGVWVAPLFYKRLEIFKNEMLITHKGNYDSVVILTTEAKEDLFWWTCNASQFPTLVARNEPSVVIKTDASNYAWGGVREEQKTGGLWSELEQCYHINCLELKAVLFTLKSLCRDLQSTHIKVFSDNSTTVACINKMGSTKRLCNTITKEIWLWCIERSNFLTAVHLPGSENIEADEESRSEHHFELEWSLNSHIFDLIISRLGECTVDLFASRLNAKIAKFVAWKPDPEAWAINAFSLNWGDFNGFCFPPFSLLPRVLQRLELQEADCVLVAPVWPTQGWYAKLIRLLIDFPILLPQTLDLLVHPVTGALHPLRGKIRLMACRLSGKAYKHMEFLQKLQTLSCQRGEMVRSDVTALTSSDGWISVLGGVKIPFHRLQLKC